MKNIKITFKTITPLWTGDAWGDNKGIRPSSIIGSLRFWFEVICYFAGITNESNYKDGKLKDDINEKDFKAKLKSNGTNFSGIDEILAEMGASLPSRIFGCTGWKGWVRIKDIGIIGKSNNYPFPTGKQEFEELKYTKEYFNRRTNKQETKEIIPTWYFNKGFYGRFEVIFEVEEKILKPIFYPLLTFMEKYGFWGGKWNIGYGRLKVEKVEINKSNNFEEVANCQKEEFGFSKFSKDKNNKFENKKFRDFLQNVSNFSDLEDRTNKILYKPENQIINDNFSSVIKELIKTKALHRHDISKNRNERHKVFGTTSGGAEGTKIIPWIYEENGQLRSGFISIAGILNLR